MDSFADAFGVHIAVHDWPVAAPRAVVQISHGIGEHAGRYAHVAARLNARGFAVVANDHRGHGRTGERQWADAPERMGRVGVGGLRAAIDVVGALTDRIHAQYPGTPVVLLAHSWGSLMAQIAIQTRSADYAGVALSGTAYRVPGWMETGDLNRRHRHLGDTGLEWLSRDPAVAERWALDPFSFPAKTAQLLGIRDGLRLFGRPKPGIRTDLPLLLQVGGDDSLGGPRSVRRLERAYRERAGLTEVSVRVYPGARHEIYNEVNRDEVIDDLVHWMGAQVLRATTND